MQNPFRLLSSLFNLNSAIDEGWDFKHERPKLSAKRKKELMESSSLETPRSTGRAIMGILTPYWTKSSWGERAKAGTLLATSLFMTWYAVQITVEFGHWQSGLTNTVQQLFQSMFTSRPEAINDIIDGFPMLQSTLANDQILNQLLMKYPDTTSVLYDPAFRDLLTQNPELVDILKTNPSLQDVFMNYPAFKEQVANNPELLNQLTGFTDKLGSKLANLDSSKTHLSNLLNMCGGDFFKNTGAAISTTFNSLTDSVKNFDLLNPLNPQSKEALKNAWYSKDLFTIALKFTAMAVISYKSAQYLALRWRSWTTGYYTSKWTSSKAFARLKNKFNNIDNPGQRIQEDPSHFTAGAVSLMTGVMNAGMQLAAFSGLLWGMGTVMGVPGGMFWVGASYAAALTGLTYFAGRKLPWIKRNQQWREADLRAACNKVHDNAAVIAQNNGEEVERNLIKRRFKPVMTNSVRDIGTSVRLIIVDATAGNLSIPIPWVAGAFAVAAGTASMGTIQTINYAFNRVTSAMSFIVNRFEQLSAMKATADRIFMFDQAIEAARYIEEEKRQAALEAVPETNNPKPPPSTPPGLSPKGA